MRQLILLFIFFSSLAFGQEQSLLYQIKSADKKVSYLFGTIHIIPDSLFFFPSKLQKIITKSDEIVLEIADVSDKTKAQELVKLESGSCFDIFSKEQKDSVLNWGATLMNIKPEQFEAAFQKTKPFVLMQLSMNKLLMGDVRMYEMELDLMAKKNKIPLSGLETMDFQLSIFDQMKPADMSRMIMEQVRNPQKSLESYLEMAVLYSKQDLNGLFKIINESDELGDSHDELLSNRNHNWIPKMIELMKTKSCFFAVGAGHLGGEDGVIQLLKNKGFEVTPVKL